MSDIKIHVFHTGTVCVAPNLPFGGENCSTIKASGLFGKRSDRIWLPVSAYLIECEHGKVLFDCGWHRNMSPDGIYNKRAQIKSLGSYPLYKTNQGLLPKSKAIDEQLMEIGIKPEDLDLVLLSHLDCDHANGMKLVANSKQILVSKDEIDFANKKTPVNMIRYNSAWWDGTKMETFDWNGVEGPAGKSYDVFGDGSLVMVNIPGHSDGLCALKITNQAGKYVLLFADGGYATKSWKEQITSGIAADKVAQKKSLEYIIEDTKTKCGTRKVPMTPEVADCFRNIIKSRKKPKAEPIIDGHTGFLFLDKNEMPMVALHWEKYFKHVLDKYNSIYRVQLPKITPHVCRHTFCSNMAKSGMNPKTLQYIMGHSEIGVTLNTYTHLTADDAQEEMLRLCANA